MSAREVEECLAQARQIVTDGISAHVPRPPDRLPITIRSRFGVVFGEHRGFELQDFRLVDLEHYGFGRPIEASHSTGRRLKATPGSSGNQGLTTARMLPRENDRDD
jgi:hypothetical protein